MRWKPKSLDGVFPQYRIIKINEVCPWQIQERFWLFFWRNKYLSFSSIRTAERELSALIKSERKVGG